jgi:hypothetical protein
MLLWILKKGDGVIVRGKRLNNATAPAQGMLSPFASVRKRRFENLMRRKGERRKITAES